MAKDYKDNLRKGIEKAYKICKKQNPPGTDFHEEIKKIADAYKRDYEKDSGSK